MNPEELKFFQECDKEFLKHIIGVINWFWRNPIIMFILGFFTYRFIGLYSVINH